MLNMCRKCNQYSSDKIIINDHIMECPHCGFQQTIVKPKLFILSGASGVGKSTVSEILYHRKKDYIVMESDILWHERYNTPDDLYKEYREMWLRLCKNISQNGTPILLCGCAAPDQFEHLNERRYFDEIYYMALVLDDDLHEKRLRVGRKIEDEDYIKGHKQFNLHLKTKADTYEPKMTVLDISQMDAKEAANQVEAWLLERC